MSNYDVIVVGGGFFGTMIADYFNKQQQKVLLIEKEAELLTRASKNNQARVHNGYHYPRNLLTAQTSHRHYQRFIDDFYSACSQKYIMLYPIAQGSKTSASDFEKVCKRIGAPIKVAGSSLSNLFDSSLMEKVFEGREAAFDYEKLRAIIKNIIKGVEVLYNSEVKSVDKGLVSLENKSFKAKRIILCAYAETNKILFQSDLPALPIRNEETVMPLVRVPEQFQNIGITIMDGEYFSIFPYPALGVHTIHHVRFTPTGGNWEYIKSHVLKLIPQMEGIEYLGNIKETKTVLLQNDGDDGRPILYKQDYGFKGLDVVVGGKIDNIYDILDKLSGDDKKDLNIVT